MEQFLKLLSDVQILLTVAGITILFLAIVGSFESKWLRLSLTRTQKVLLALVGGTLIVLAVLPNFFGQDLDTLPEGTIITWDPQIRDESGAVIPSKMRTLPMGWQICDGKNGTPDLSEKFILATASVAQAGQTGGTTSIPIETVRASGTTSQETITDPRSGGFETDPPGNETGKHTHILNVTVEPHNHGGNNLPPYYKLVFIMKVRTPLAATQ